ncbi:protein DOP1 homolog isoform X2 [Chironomus tepperi]|uniref:protein DOP1 homolog isoform X2 n=1 Tax=Chironomus tepperi TaxID=113505 RepID=UPI00391F9420
MDSMTGSVLMEEFELMKQSKYRVYMQNIDKALKNFEYSSEWADLISALGKLNKVISSYPQYQVIPRRIKISKRLSQCMHPALPSGVHLKALETYDVIFSNTGIERLASDLFIYSSGLFPLMQYAAMNVRPFLLEIYEKYFVPLGERLRPALSGFLSGVLPGLEAGLDHFERTNLLLNRVCCAVNPMHFYTCLWESVATNSSIRLPAITYVIDNFNKRLGINEQIFLIGKNIDLMISGLCACLNDSVILVQRNTLEFLLLGFPLHTTILSQKDLIKLVTNGLNTILRRDMSLNRRVYSWFLGTEVLNSSKNTFDNEEGVKILGSTKPSIQDEINHETYFEKYSKNILIKALKITLKNSILTTDLKPYKILLSLLDKIEIGPVVLDSILIDVIRTAVIVDNCSEVKKSINSLFGNFDPSYIWKFLTMELKKACLSETKDENKKLPENMSLRTAHEIDYGDPSVIELCYLVECLLDMLSLEMFNETTRIFLPRMLFSIIKIITQNVSKLDNDEITASINLCIKIIQHTQPMILCASNAFEEVFDEKNNMKSDNTNVTFQEQVGGLEKSKSDSKINQTAMDEPIKRSRSNYSMMGAKKSPRKSKKSKSHSKLFELDKEIFVDSENVFVKSSNATSTPNLDNENEKNIAKKKRDKKSKKIDYTEKSDENKDLSDAKTKINDTIECESISNSSVINSLETNYENEVIKTQLQKYTILEKCSKQYEIFFQVYFSNCVLKLGNDTNIKKLTNENEELLVNADYYFDDNLIETGSNDTLQKIDELFLTLKLNKVARERKLKNLLNQTIDIDSDIDVENSKNNVKTNENLKIINKMIGSKLDLSTKRAIKYITQLLVTFSTIPNYDQTCYSLENEEEKQLPYWLKVLSLVATFSKGDKDLQIICISTLFELIEIVKFQKEKKPSRDVQHLVMLPLLKYSHIMYMENQTRIFQVLVSTLWDHLDILSDSEMSQISLLLYRIHGCLDSGIVEKIISERIGNSHLLWSFSEINDSDLEENNDRLSKYKLERLSNLKIMLNFPDMSATNCNSQLTERQYIGFKKFELLWHLGREQKESFDKIALKMYDNLGLSHNSSIRTFIVKWLKEALLRGDLERLLKPLLRIMLNKNTKRISISNTHLLKIKNVKKMNEQVFDENKINDDVQKINSNSKENEMYVIKMEDGIVRNHLESTKKKGHIGIPKKILNIATKSSNIGDKMREKGLLPAVSLNNQIDASENDFDSMELFVNPLEQQQEKKILINKCDPSSVQKDVKKFIIESSSDYSTTSSAESITDHENSEDEIKMKNKCSKGLKNEKYQSCYDESGTAADEYFSINYLENNDEDTKNGIENEIKISECTSKEKDTNSQHKDINCPNVEKENSKEKAHGEEDNDIEKDQIISDSRKNIINKKKKLKINQKISNKALEKGKANVEILKKNFDEFDGFFQTKLEKFHPFHTHLLLYYSCYDTKQILYCIETLRNIIMAGNSKLFICLSINTCVSDSTLKHLLIRHRKSIFGKGFEGSLTNTEFNSAYKGVMYIEVLITICLYYARSYFQCCDPSIGNSDSEKEDEDVYRIRNNEIPTRDEILANCKIQLAAIEMLHLIFNELVPIVKEMGKGLASYIADLMIKCKVQKVVLHCVLTSIHYLTTKVITTSSEKTLKFNDPGDEKLHLEAIQIQLLKLLDDVIKLEYETIAQKGDQDTAGNLVSKGTSSISAMLSQSPTRPRPITRTSNNVKYIQNLTITQQPMFLTSILNALASENLKHLHKNWTELVTSTLNYVSYESLSNIIVSITHQLCENIDNIIKSSNSNQNHSDYCISQLEALTVICHFCLLDNNQQVSLSHLFNPQNISLTLQPSGYGQIYNNILNFFLSTSPLQLGEAYSKHQLQHNATRMCVLSHLPRIISSMVVLWETKLGQDRLVKQQLMEFITPIALHHGCNFIASIAVVWHERSDKKLAKNKFKFQDPANPTQLSLVDMVLHIKVIPFDSLVQTINSVIKSPPQIYRPPDDIVLSVSVLEFFYVLMKNIKSENLNDSWTSVMNLFKDSISLSPRAQFMIFCILHELVKVCSPYERKDKKDIRELHDITTRLIEALSGISGACLEQTTWLRRNLAVKEEVTDEFRDGNLTPTTGNQQYSVEAQSLLGYILVNVLDYAFGSQEKDKITQIVTTLMYNIIPYLKNHTTKNIQFFYACSNLLSTLTPYQYTRKAWRKDVFDLFLDPTFFQMDVSCLPFWKQILDNLMSYDNITFRELMSRLSVAQTGSLSIFTSKEQEYEQKAMLLKKLAFVIYCSEKDQYQKYMPEIQEQLSSCLRLPQVISCVQAAVLLCFRVLLLRMSPDHVTSLWPTIIAEMVQVFLSIEQELMTDTEEFRTQSSQHIRMLSGLDTAWITNTNNGLNAQNHSSWRMVQLETAKLLELGCVLPASSLPHFQMYRWAFVGSQHDQYSTDVVSEAEKELPQFCKFIPHITRISHLMDFRYNSQTTPNNLEINGSRLTLTCQSINSLQDLYGFFSTLCIRLPSPQNLFNDENDLKTILSDIENVLSSDFLEKMPQSSK